MSDYLFAYGSLQPGFAPDEVAKTAAKLRAVSRGFVYGERYELDGYPGVVPNSRSKNRVGGTVLELPEDAGLLEQLDEYEGYDPEAPETSEFVRMRQLVQLSGGGTLECWFYRYNGKPKA